MHRTKKVSFVAASVTAVGLALAGCSSSSSGGGGSDGKITLSFSSYAFQPETVKATQDIVDSWNASHPKIHIDYQKVDPNSVHDKLVTQFAGKSAPDIIHDEAADIAGFGRQGYLADLTDLVPSDLKNDVAQGVWDSVTVDKKIVGVPTIAQVYNVFANTDALKAAGIALPTAASPWTWDDLATNAKKLTKGNGNYGFAWGLKSPTAGVMSSGLAFGGTYFSGDAAKPDIKIGPKEMQVPNRLRAMLHDKTMAPNSVSLGGSDVLPAFFGGKYAMVMAGNYVAAQVEEKAPKSFHWTMLPVLKGTSQAQASDPQTLSVARQSKHPKEAMQFISYYLKASNLAKVAEGDSLIPVTKSATEIAKKDEGNKHGEAAILESGQFLVNAPWQSADAFPKWKSDIATPAFQEFLSGKIDSSTLSKRLTEGWNKVKG